MAPKWPPNGGPMASKWLHIAPKAQFCIKLAPGCPRLRLWPFQRSPTYPNQAPRCFPMLAIAPKWLPITPQSLQISPTCPSKGIQYQPLAFTLWGAQDGPQMIPNCFQMGQDWFKMAQDGSRISVIIIILWIFLSSPYSRCSPGSSSLSSLPSLFGASGNTGVGENSEGIALVTHPWLGLKPPKMASKWLNMGIFWHLVGSLDFWCNFDRFLSNFWVQNWSKMRSKSLKIWSQLLINSYVVFFTNFLMLL